MAEHQLPKLSVEGSIPFARSNNANLFCSEAAGMFDLEPSESTGHLVVRPAFAPGHRLAACHPDLHRRRARLRCGSGGEARRRQVAYAMEGLGQDVEQEAPTRTDLRQRGTG